MALAVADLTADFDAMLQLAATGPKRTRSPAVLPSVDVALLCISNQFSPQFSEETSTVGSSFGSSRMPDVKK